MDFFRRRHLVSPIIFLVFITFFSSALSRHRIRHHRDRFKRQQGEHLYLAGSYVEDGGTGPDIGPWSEWSSPSPCSRTCGGGVSTIYRQCQTSYCQGPTTRHFSCNTQDCPDTGDFRAQQCSEYDSTPFEGVLYQWVPYTKAPNQCELNCMPRGERFYYRHRNEVVDGTRCNDESLDVCVQGKCQPVGCDMMLGSSAREDKCRVCGGDGSTCNTVNGLFDDQNLQVGYNDILLIPSGATNVVVQEVAPSNNYLAVRNTSGHYYLNGNWRIDFPRSLDFAGTKFHYEREPHGFSAPDKVWCLGPTEEALFIVLLYQDTNVGVEYEYSLPTNIVPGSENETYAWTFDQFTPCTATCGGGIQYRNVTCAGRKTLEPVDRTLCDANNEPASSQRCGEIPCDAQWVPYPWGNCSAPCGEGGIQTREVSCQQVVSNGYPSIVSEELCLQSQPKPPTQQPCNQGKVCATWHIGPWKPCDHLCGDGKQIRKVRCYIKEGDEIKALDDSECPDPKPENEQKCNVRPCEGVDWVTSEWSGCENKCGLANETRRVQCATASGEIFSDELCEKEQKPVTVRECDTSNTICEYLWYASQWSECSAKCGEGVQTRTVFCGVKGENNEVKPVENDKCDPSKTFETIKNCTSEVKECPGEWFSGPWTKCSKPCGGGVKTKQVVCIKENKVVGPAECGQDKITFSQEDCNTQPCSEDAIIPTDVTKSIDESEGETEATPLTTEISETEIPSEDEYEIVPDDECEDGEWVDAEDEDVSGTALLRDEQFTTEATTGESEKTSFSLDDIMLSDSPASPEETQSTALFSETEVTGSGDGSTSVTSSDASSIYEGSGDESSVTETSETSFSKVDSSAQTGSESTSESSTFASSDGSTISPEGSSVGETEATASSSSSDLTTESVAASTSPSDFTIESSSPSSNIAESQESTTELSSTSEISSSPSSDSTTEATSESSEASSTLTASSEGSSDTTTESGTSESSGSSETTTEGVSISTTEGVSVSTTEGVSISTTEGVSVSTTESVSISTTEGVSVSTTEGVSVSTTEGVTESETEFTGSTESVTVTESGISTESTSAGSTQSTTEFTGSTETTTEFTGSTESTTEFTGSTESTTEFTGSTEFDIWSSSTTEESTESTSVTEIFITAKPRMCKRKKQKDCHKSEFGCCWDNITPAEGPFDQGCPLPKTCKESKFGCCEDGVSPALGPKFKGCPPPDCKESLFGCCPDNKTPAEGNNKEGCPPPPPACLKSKWGCCKDNVTAAKGPKQKGCEKEQITTTTTTTTPEPEGFCSNSTYGCCPDGKKSAKGEYFKGCDIIKANCNESYWRCCPDGVTSAEGPNYKGCKVPCSDGPFGCCPDGITPAHGYSGEGCCLSSPHGCCPDNILPAKGPNLEGCGCQYSPYGCCPDNVTASRGYNKEGCGCKYTEHGCCPDDYTPAAGPEYQGCLCHTYQFGCCPDGVTIAKGPHQQGCGCRNTEFGCCSDDQTPAKGPNKEGCGCDSSKYGCCLDGVTEALGENYEGCQDIPVNLQASCHLAKERGPCHNFTVKWFYDLEYGGCSRFWYGGCDGNGNRFRSKEECRSVCVEPQGKERCNLPKVHGPCEDYHVYWHFDQVSKRCGQFIYGGCLGNNNRFETREECMQLCETDGDIDACEQPKEEGPCRGSYARWYFDKETKSCQMFRYGGCKANNNNFPTEEACKQQCAKPGRKKDHCSLPRAQGNCTAKEPRWYYDIPEKRCVPFYYSGCNGNNNNFISREACENDCPRDIEKDLCHLPAETGECGNYVDRWYFDTAAKGCRQFYYGGCGGNGNNFENQQACQARCEKPQEPTVTEPPPPPPPPTAPQQQQFVTEFCLQPNDTGSCTERLVRYYYDRNDGVCKSFTYGGCGGNRNNFETKEECFQYCGNAQDLCNLPPVVGPCNSNYEQWYYDPRTDSCYPFNYGGCDGNVNRFQDLASCEQRCRKSTPQVPITQAPPISSNEPTMCYERADPGNCYDNQTAFYYDINTRRCVGFTYTGCGGNGNRFNSEEQCERQCGQFRDQDVCSMSRDVGPCRGYFVKYYFDKDIGRCGQFAYGGCGGNGNRFSSNEECESVCVTHEDVRPNTTTTPPVITAAEPHPCQELFDECATLHCPYGIQAYVDQNQCNRCQCVDPCANVECPAESQCAIDLNRNRTSPNDPNFIAVCRKVNKEGQCPNLQPRDNCEQECRNDADCTLDLKCCSAGCHTSCVEPITEVPAELVTQPYLPAFTEEPIEQGYAPPAVDQSIYKPEVQALLGDHVILNCAVRGNPTPKITWKKDNLLIDGTEAKYRIKFDQSLQIVTLHKTDSGIYLCTADNAVGPPITNQIKLDVLDSPPRPASILVEPEEPQYQVVSLNAPATLHCLALGYPFPAVTWWKDDSLIPLKTSQFEVRKDYSLLIHSVKLHNLGIYTCQAYNGIGKAASWAVTVQAKGPYYSTNPKDQEFLKYIINPPEVPTTPLIDYPYRPAFRPTSQPYNPPEFVYTEPSPHIDPNEIVPIVPEEPPQPQASHIVPVQTNISLESPQFPVSSQILIPCLVIGFPTPQVKWYKDGVQIQESERIKITDDNQLIIQGATKADSGSYSCEATNSYYKSISNILITVEGKYIHPNCKDNPYFAKCEAIVKARFCNHKYYARFCCRSCTEANQLPVDGPHLKV